MQKLLAVAATFAASANALNIMKQAEANILAEADIFKHDKHDHDEHDHDEHDHDEHYDDVVFDLAKDRPHH